MMSPTSSSMSGGSPVTLNTLQSRGMEPVYVEVSTPRGTSKVLVEMDPKDLAKLATDMYDATVEKHEPDTGCLSCCVTPMKADGKTHRSPAPREGVTSRLDASRCCFRCHGCPECCETTCKTTAACTGRLAAPNIVGEGTTTEMCPRVCTCLSMGCCACLASKCLFGATLAKSMFVGFLAAVGGGGSSNS